MLENNARDALFASCGNYVLFCFSRVCYTFSIKVALLSKSIQGAFPKASDPFPYFCRHKTITRSDTRL